MKARSTYSTTFIVRSSRSKNGLLPIYCRITVNSMRAEFSIQRSVPADQWDNGKVRGTNETAKTLNAYLKEIEGIIFDHSRDMRSMNKLVTADALKNAYLGIKEDEYTLVQLFDYHNKELKETVEWGTMKNYHTTKKYVEAFLKAKLRTKDIALSQLNYKFLIDFELFVKAHKPVDHQKPCGQNTAMKHIERFRKIINMAVKYEWLSRDPFAQFKARFTKTTRESLTQEQLLAIEAKEFEIERLQWVKDLFVFSCYTGLSYIDVMSLTPSHITLGISGGKWIYTSRKKTDNVVRIPLLSKANEIIKKYENHPKALSHGTLFPLISNQKLNAYLKEIADVCGINKNLTFHLARHTFATTITLTNGVPIETVSKLLGHSSIRTTQIYAKVLEKKVSDEMKTLQEKLDLNLGVKSGT